MPLCVKEGPKQQLWASSTNDTKFLASCSMMDYSMLVGLDFEKKCIVAGIIDYVREYTWDKQVETIIKTKVYDVRPTITPPQEYRSRFLSSMWGYFVFVPDHYTGTPLPQDEKPKEKASTDDAN